MTYYDVVNKAVELCITTDLESGVTYLEPLYRSILFDNNVYLPGRVLPGDPKDQELWEILKLEVEKRNAKHNVSHALAEWAYSIISQTIDPALAQEENELMKNINEYLNLQNQKPAQESEDADE